MLCDKCLSRCVVEMLFALEQHRRNTHYTVCRLVYRGWRQPLVQSDLWDVQARDLTLVHSTRLQKNWNYEVAKSKRYVLYTVDNGGVKEILR